MKCAMCIPQCPFTCYCVYSTFSLFVSVFVSCFVSFLIRLVLLLNLHSLSLWVILSGSHIESGLCIVKMRSERVRCIQIDIDFSSYMVHILFYFDWSLSRFMQPYLLLWLIRYFSGEEGYSETFAWFCACGIGVISLMRTYLHNLVKWMGDQLSMKMRIASCALIYRKVRCLVYISS